MRSRIVAAFVAVAVLVIAIAVVRFVQRPSSVRTTVQTVAGTAEPGQGAVQLDTTLYLPEHTPAPAVLLSQGFGGSKDGLAGQARSLARHGYVVLAYTARGFGRSGGRIHLDAPAFEVADARKLIDYLATLTTVQKDGPGDPRVGVAGGSYGGALALLTAGYDQRVDAVAADITWNNLAQALLPNYALTGSGGGGVFKRLWAGVLFGSGSAQLSSGSRPGAATTSPSVDASSPSGSSAPVSSPSGPSPSAPSAAIAGSAQCGRFSAALCRAYSALAQGRSADAATTKLLADSSPASVLNRIHAPTLLSQGEQDSLFPLSEADANARGIAAHGTPVSVVWRLGGHDTGDGTDVAEAAAQRWFDDVLRAGRAPQTFDMTLRGAGISAQSGQRVSQTLHARGGYPGVHGGVRSTSTVALSGPTQTINAPAGGTPAAVSSLPGLSSVLDLAGNALGALTRTPGQTAQFDSAPVRQQRLVAGASTVNLSVTAVNASDATLFVAAHDVAPDGSDTLPAQLVTAVRVSGLTPNQPRTVRVQLPAVLFRLAAGHRLRVTVSSTDQAYLLPNDPRSYRIALSSTAGPGAGALQVPTLATTSARDTTPLIWLVLGILAALAAVAAATVMGGRASTDEGGRSGARRKDSGRASTDEGGRSGARRKDSGRASTDEGGRSGARRRDSGRASTDRRAVESISGADEVPVVITDLVKEYSDGFRAVDGVSFRVERGQIVGLLGPNGAGKTTTLRVLMGLIQPTTGSVAVFGETIHPGSPVLARVGAFIEGPGLLPHLSGLDNLRLFWAASGRPAQEAQFDTALEIAGLGSSIQRRVKTYSQGMRQRLAIAQSMLGLPELLVLDEPTNGLDPPQIAEMRQVLRSYAATGRTVVISSHLLAEVEQTCSHVVVMHRGRLVAAGSVVDVAGTGSVALAVDDPAGARRVLAAAGIRSEEVPGRRALEDVFLELVED